MCAWGGEEKFNDKLDEDNCWIISTAGREGNDGLGNFEDLELISIVEEEQRWKEFQEPVGHGGIIFKDHLPSTDLSTTQATDMQINEVFCDYLSSTDNQQQTTVMIFLQGRVSLKV